VVWKGSNLCGSLLRVVALFEKNLFKEGEQGRVELIKGFNGPFHLVDFYRVELKFTFLRLRKKLLVFVHILKGLRTMSTRSFGVPGSAANGREYSLMS
jgi:hypothetical protein